MPFVVVWALATLPFHEGVQAVIGGEVGWAGLRTSRGNFATCVSTTVDKRETHSHRYTCNKNTREGPGREQKTDKAHATPFNASLPRTNTSSPQTRNTKKNIAPFRWARNGPTSSQETSTILCAKIIQAWKNTGNAQGGGRARASCSPWSQRRSEAAASSTPAPGTEKPAGPLPPAKRTSQPVSQPARKKDVPHTRPRQRTA